MANFDIAIPKLLKKEGGSKYTEIPGDNGGATKFGVSKAAHPELDIQNLTEQEAKGIYKRDYWDKCTCDAIESQLVAEEIFECAVNMGATTTAKLVQLVVGVTMDGRIGPATRLAIAGIGDEFFLCQLKLAIIARYAHLCNQDRSQCKFLLGWINRVIGGV